ncbi:uncharacterized protein LOC124365367 [Homalodisca vitripennis]|uniref:uncharacterized protein LOC124365367 n=1 Tax=Homalodisca vitripennis TaxID=197043 RepID=UPI001EEC38BE|nr:uncharacterized protein LOC124365367 [Homalodisca vitripennis]
MDYHEALGLRVYHSTLGGSPSGVVRKASETGGDGLPPRFTLPGALGTTDNAPTWGCWRTDGIIRLAWEATKCLLCQSWFTLARDLTDHHEEHHGDHLLRFRCTGCRTLFKTFRGASVHLPKCKGSPVAVGVLCPDCGRVYPNKRGLGVHRSANHPEQVNVERLREEDRRAASASAPILPARPRSSGWTEDEDRTFIRRYLEFRTTRRAMGYSAYVALELPRKTERQVRDRLVTLRGYRYPYGLLDAPEPPAPHPPSQGLASAPRRGPSTPGSDIALVGHDSPGAPGIDFTPDGHDSSGEPDQDATPSAGQRGAPGLDDTPVGHDFPGGSLVPLGCQAGVLGRRPAPRTDREDGSGLGAPAEPPDGEQGPATATPLRETHVRHLPRQRPPGDSPPASPPGAAPDPGLRRGHWQKVLDEILGTEPVCHVGARLNELAAQEGDIQVRLDELVEELQAAMVATQPVTARVRRPAFPTTGRSERTRRKVTRYARTQELYKKNPSCLADLVLKNELGDLLADGPRAMPPKWETLELYRGMWGAPVDCTLSKRGVDLQEDELVESFSGDEVRRRVGRLKAGGAPGLDGVTKRAITGYAGAAGTHSVLFNICLFRGAFPSSWLRNRTTLIPKPGKDLARPENWKPITIAPLLARIYSAGIEARLTARVSLSDRQRGFRPGNGCLVNCTILDEVIRLGKRSELVGVQLDVSKAFDTVSHQAIFTVLEAQGVPACIQQTIRWMYSDCSSSPSSHSSSRRGSENIKKSRLTPEHYDYIEGSAAGTP